MFDAHRFFFNLFNLEYGNPLLGHNNDWEEGDFEDFNMNAMVSIDWTSLCGGYPYKQELEQLIKFDWWTPQVEKVRNNYYCF